MQNTWIGAIAAVLLTSACSSSDNQQAPATQPDTDASAEAQADVSHADQASEPQIEAATELTPDAPACVPESYTPTPQQIGFKPLNPMPSGEQLLVGYWSSNSFYPDGGFAGVLPDRIESMKPDGTAAVTLFEVYRMWSMGVSRAVDKIAFACGDPEQQKHFCVNIGDAIQHTWMYDIATQQVSVVTSGNVNDECHLFGPGDSNLYLCRRSGMADGEAPPKYTVGRIKLSDNSYELLDEQAGIDMSLHPVPNGDETELYYTLITSSTNGRTLMRKGMGAGAGNKGDVFLDEAGAMKLSPDGTKFVFANTQDKSKLYIADVASPTTSTKIADVNGNTVTFSPDGTKIAYLIWDNAHSCSHIEVVKTDGSEAATPTRIQDCAVSFTSPSELAWVVRP